MSTAAHAAPDHEPVPMSVHRSESSSDFFDAAARGVLLIRRCAECDHLRAARRAVCRRCGSGEFAWQEASGTASLMTWAANASRDAAVPSSSFGLVELTEGPWLEALLIGAEPTDLHEGAPFVVTFVRGVEGDSFPAFRPAEKP